MTLPALLLALASLAEQIAREQPSKRCGHLAVKAKEAAKAMRGPNVGRSDPTSSEARSEA